MQTVQQQRLLNAAVDLEILSVQVPNWISQRNTLVVCYFHSTLHYGDAAQFYLASRISEHKQLAHRQKTQAFVIHRTSLCYSWSRRSDESGNHFLVSVRFVAKSPLFQVWRDYCAFRQFLFCDY